MALLCYMQVISHHGELPDPAGPLLAALKLLLIKAANAAVSAAREAESGTAKAKRGPYNKLNEQTRAKIEKYANEHSNTTAARNFSKVLGKPLNRTTTLYNGKKFALTQAKGENKFCEIFAPCNPSGNFPRQK